MSWMSRQVWGQEAAYRVFKEDKARGNMKKIILLIILAFAVASCTTVNKSSERMRDRYTNNE